MYGSQTPIDIHCAKLVDWLVQRRHCKRDWGENLASIRRKIKSAIKDMPENEEIKQLLIGSKLDYYKSKRIVEILKTTEASSKNIFGYYSSQRMKDWQDIVYSYENDCIYLAEISTDLIRETNYEIPGIRRVIQRLSKEKDDTEKERQTQIRRAQQFRSEHQKLAQTYGIKGENVLQELKEQSHNIQKVMEEIVDSTRVLEDAVKYYREYASSMSKQDQTKIIPTLFHVIIKGNTTCFEWKYGESPSEIVPNNPTDSGPTSEANSNPSEIELGTDEIDFGDDLEVPSSESSSGFVHVNVEATGNADEAFINMPHQTDTTVTESKVARGEDAKLVLESRKPRNQFLNNLYEIEAFFQQLLTENTNTSDQSSSFMSSSNNKARRYDDKDINELLSHIKLLISIMNKEKNKVLFQMSDSKRFALNLNDKLAAKCKQAKECEIKAEQLGEKAQDLQAQIRETEVHLKKSSAMAKELQHKVEATLTEIYRGRTINIMGCVA